MVEEKLARIPFAAADEETIDSMARWMRFMAVVGLIAGFLMLFVVVIGGGVVSAGHGLGGNSPKGADLRRFLDEAGAWLYLLLAAGLIAAVATLWQNFALYHAGEDFHLLARTDVADLDYLAHGLDKLRTYFKIQVLIVVVTLAAGLCTALVMVAATSHAR